MIIAVDFDGTLALDNGPHISALRPNRALIKRLQEARAASAPYIKIVTARGGKAGLSAEEKNKAYRALIEQWLEKYGVPYDEISFNKEYANLYIDDQTIGQHEPFEAISSTFTGNKIIFTSDSVIKMTSSALLEQQWYAKAFLLGFKTPKVLFCNNECIITERVHNYEKPTADVFIRILKAFSGIVEQSEAFSTYLENIPSVSSEKIKQVLPSRKNEHYGTFFHGDLSTHNVLYKPIQNTPYLIDSNSKYIFGSYITDAGKAVFSLIAYENAFSEAKKIVDYFGLQVWRFAVAEGLRVCKYRPEYMDIVNNIADYIHETTNH